jgi:hypothetical protein
VTRATVVRARAITKIRTKEKVVTKAKETVVTKAKVTVVTKAKVTVVTRSNRIPRPRKTLMITLQKRPSNVPTLVPT